MELSNKQILFNYGLIEDIHYKLTYKNNFTYNNVKYYMTNTSAFKIEQLTNFIEKWNDEKHIVFITLYDTISNNYFSFDFCWVEKSLIDVRLNKIYNIRKRIFEEKMKPFFEKEYKLLK